MCSDALFPSCFAACFQLFKNLKEAKLPFFPKTIALLLVVCKQFYIKLRTDHRRFSPFSLLALSAILDLFCTFVQREILPKRLQCKVIKRNTEREGAVHAEVSGYGDFGLLAVPFVWFIVQVRVSNKPKSPYPLTSACTAPSLSVFRLLTLHCNRFGSISR